MKQDIASKFSQCAISLFACLGNVTKYVCIGISAVSLFSGIVIGTRTHDAGLIPKVSFAVAAVEVANGCCQKVDEWTDQTPKKNYYSATSESSLKTTLAVIPGAIAGAMAYLTNNLLNPTDSQQHDPNAPQFPTKTPNENPANQQKTFPPIPQI